jgi:outer membrane protein OmpA-like peptidoglycan-associated protein
LTKTIVRAFGVSTILLSLAAVPAQPAKGEPPSAVQATNPLAYFRLESLQGKSETGEAQFHTVGGVRSWPGGVTSSGPEGHFALLDGYTGFVETTQIGGIQSAASVMAWVILGATPSGDRHYFYVAGESQFQNDFDLQFERDDVLKFYTGSHEPLEYKPDPATLVGHWHMIVATVDAATGHRAIYWDGAPVAGDDQAKEMKPKAAEFTLGNSKVFSDRFLDGGIDDAAIWGSALTPDQVMAIYLSAKHSDDWATAGAPPPPTCSTTAPPLPAAAHPKPVTLPAYLGFLPGMVTILSTETATWDEEQFPPGPWGDGSNAKRGKRLGIDGLMASDCNDKKLAFNTLKAGFLGAGWEADKMFDTQPLMGVLHYNKDGVEAWVDIDIGGPPRLGMQFIEVAPIPIQLTLAAPAATPEKIVPQKGDFPYLASIPGSKLRGGAIDKSPFYVQLPGADQPELVATGMILKNYVPPAGLSLFEFQAVYHDALLKAGWTIVREFRGADAATTAHYGQNGRNIWAYLHANSDGYGISVSDAGGAGELAADLAKDCHVALTGVLFDFNKSTLKPESDAVLERVQVLLAKDPSLVKVEVQGHTDIVGGDAYNQTLSEARAQSVMAWLTGHGVAADRLSAQGYGKTRPVADNNTDEGRAKNRRVEIANLACKPKGK